MARLLIRLSRGLLASALLLAGGASAQTLTDPTRPPDAFGVAGQEANTGGLQSIIRGKGGKPGAIIDGEYVVLGGKVGDATLVKIGEDSVTLKRATGTEVLQLMPGVEKTPARAEQIRNRRSGPANKVMK